MLTCKHINTLFKFIVMNFLIHTPFKKGKKRQATVILTVPSGGQPGGCLFMKPGSVSVRPFQARFPQTSSDQVDPAVKPEGFTVGSGCSRRMPFRAAPFCIP
jgi:hypothetical protein